MKEQEDASNVYLEKDGTLFLLYPRNSFEEMTNRSFNYAPGINGHYEIALRVDSENDLDLIFKEIVSKGAAPIMAPKRMEWGSILHILLILKGILSKSVLELKIYNNAMVYYVG